jgi:hypothetical protein
MAESFVLNTGARIPSVGLGVWQIQLEAVGDVISAAVKVFPDCTYSLLIFLSFQQKSRMSPGCFFFKKKGKQEGGSLLCFY